MRLSIMGMLALAGCGKGEPPVADITTVTSYEAEQVACVETAKTRAEADECRAAVKKRYGR